MLRRYRHRRMKADWVLSFQSKIDISFVSLQIEKICSEHTEIYHLLSIDYTRTQTTSKSATAMIFRLSSTHNSHQRREEDKWRWWKIPLAQMKSKCFWSCIRPSLSFKPNIHQRQFMISQTLSWRLVEISMRWRNIWLVIRLHSGAISKISFLACLKTVQNIDVLSHPKVEKRLTRENISYWE